MVLLLGAVAFSVMGQLFLKSGAQRLTSLTYVLILIASVYLFGEQIRRLHIVGTVLIVIGIACLLSGD